MAKAPITNGAAILVPSKILYEPLFHVELILTPGAAISIADPKLLSLARESS
jgi:hypothetical protein